MTWPLIAQLLAQFGPSAFDLITKLIEKWNSADPVTVADIDELRRLGQRTSKSAVLEALNRAGVALDSDLAKSLLALSE